MTTERVNNSPFAWAVQMLPGECCSYGQVHGRDESLPYKLKIKAIQRRSCGPGMPGPYAEGSRPLPTKPTRKGAQPLGCGPGMPGPYILLYGSQKIK